MGRLLVSIVMNMFCAYLPAQFVGWMKLIAITCCVYDIFTSEVLSIPFLGKVKRWWSMLSFFIWPESNISNGILWHVVILVTNKLFGRISVTMQYHCNHLNRDFSFPHNKWEVVQIASGYRAWPSPVVFSHRQIFYRFVRHFVKVFIPPTSVEGIRVYRGSIILFAYG